MSFLEDTASEQRGVSVADRAWEFHFWRECEAFPASVGGNYPRVPALEADDKACTDEREPQEGRRHRGELWSTANLDLTVESNGNCAGEHWSR